MRCWSAGVVCLCAMMIFSGSRAVADVPLETMIGQMILIGFRGYAAPEKSPIREDIRAGRIGGVVLFDRDVELKSTERNIQSPEQVTTLVRQLQKDARIPLLVAIDQEGGRVARLKPDRGFPATRTAQSLGEANDSKATHAAGRAVGETLKELGIQFDLAPVVDVNVNPENPVIGKLGRSFSPDPEKVAVQAHAFLQGLQDAKVIACIKHFPGHGSAWNDSHAGLTDVTETWTEKELIPFQRLIDTGECRAIMTAHLFNKKHDAVWPATLSPVVLGYLRTEMHFTGVIISDDLQMGAIVNQYGFEEAVRQGVRAGLDILLFGNNLHYDPDVATKVHTIIRDMVEKKEISPDRIRASYDRIMTLKQALRIKQDMSAVRAQAQTHEKSDMTESSRPDQSEKDDTSYKSQENNMDTKSMVE